MEGHPLTDLQPSAREKGETADSRVERVYEQMARLPMFRHPVPYERLPVDGIYFFFEDGETVELTGHVLDRIVRVGTHREDGRFRKRIQQHFGRVRTLGGN